MRTLLLVSAMAVVFSLPAFPVLCAVDSDLDTVIDGADNCVFAPNPGQADSGGLNTLVANGRGDACECGDASDDGPVTGADVDALRESLADPLGAPLSAGGSAKCTVHGDRPELCSILDVAILVRALEPTALAPGIASACDASVCPTCVSANSPSVGGCQILPESDPWNQDISALPVHSRSAIYIAAHEALTSTADYLHLDFGSTETEYGIPWLVSPPATPLVPISYGTDGLDYSEESDPGPFRIPLDAAIEGGTPSSPNPTSGDRHVIAVDQATCDLVELSNTVRTGMPVSGFMVSSSARWNLLAPVPRPAGWMSAQASGLPILPGLLRRGEVARGRVDHALRVLFTRAARAYVAPASNFGGHLNDTYLPYGARLRLRASYSEAGYGADAVVLIRALKRFGMIFSDIGSSAYLSGTSDPAWAPLLTELNAGASRIPLAQFDVVDTGNAVCAWATPNCF